MEKGYIHLTREWRLGDVVNYRMGMPIRAIWAHSAASDLEGRVALERSPLIYCLEGIDHPGTILDLISIDPHNVSNEFQVEHNDKLLSGVGVSVLRGKGTVVDENGWENVLYRNNHPRPKA